MKHHSRFFGVDTIMIDVVLKVASLPGKGLDEMATSRLVTAGGGFNALSAATRQGMPSVYLGQLGSGPFADIARQALVDEGIEALIVPTGDSDLGFCLVLVEDDGERTFVTSPGAEGSLRASDLAAVLLQEGDVIFMSGYDFVYEEICREVLNWLRTIPETALVAFDPGSRVLDIRADVLNEVIARTDWLLCNASEAALLVGGAQPVVAAERLLERTGRQGVVVRNGGEGCVAASRGGSTFLVPAVASVVVDTNGAGDVHNGVFLAELARGTGVLEALRRANVAASIAIGVLGPATCPSREVVSARLTSAF
jgi:sugar/nucleoside kinase (ribokinase family)